MLFGNKNKVKNYKIAEDTADMPYPSANAADGQVYRSFLLMRIMLTAVNIASLLFCRSFMQSWNSIHGTFPVWIPIAFSLIPLGSLVFIYLFMGKLGSERIIKLICIALLILHLMGIFFPPSVAEPIEIDENGSSSYLTDVQNELGMVFPSGRVMSIDGSVIMLENPDDGLMDRLKRYTSGERLYSCTDLSLDEEKAADFKKTLEGSPVWLKKIPKRLKELPFSALDTSGYDYLLFFDCDGKSFNSVPNGKAVMYQLMYSSKYDTLRILKYSKNF